MTSTTLRHDQPGERDRNGGAPIRLPAHVSSISQARTEVRAAARRAGIHSDRIDDLMVAVSEACTNALEAQLAAGVEAPLELAVRAAKGCFEVSIRDSGDGFEPSALAPRPPLGHAQHLDVERGWGIQLMRELVDELVFDIADRGTTVTLRLRSR